MIGKNLYNGLAMTFNIADKILAIQRKYTANQNTEQESIKTQ